MVLPWFAGAPLVAASNSSAAANHTHLALPLPDGSTSLAGLRRPESLAGSTERLHALMQARPSCSSSSSPISSSSSTPSPSSSCPT